MSVRPFVSSFNIRHFNPCKYLTWPKCVRVRPAVPRSGGGVKSCVYTIVAGTFSTTTTVCLRLCACHSARVPRLRLESSARQVRPHAKTCYNTTTEAFLLRTGPKKVTALQLRKRLLNQYWPPLLSDPDASLSPEITGGGAMLICFPVSLSRLH